MQDETERQGDVQDQVVDSTSVTPTEGAKPVKVSNKKRLLIAVITLALVAALWMLWVWFALGDDASANTSQLSPIYVNTLLS